MNAFIAGGVSRSSAPAHRIWADSAPLRQMLHFRDTIIRPIGEQYDDRIHFPKVSGGYTQIYS